MTITTMMTAAQRQGVPRADLVYHRPHSRWPAARVRHLLVKGLGFRVQGLGIAQCQAF